METIGIPLTPVFYAYSSDCACLLLAYTHALPVDTPTFMLDVLLEPLRIIQFGFN